MPEADIIRAARWFGGANAVLSLYYQGLNQSSHGTHNAALIHLHLAAGQIGRPGAGPFSLTVLADRSAERDGRTRSR